MIDTVAAALFSNPSLARKVNVAVPVNPFCGGLYVTFGAVPVSVPVVGLLTMLKVSGLFSGSVPVSVIGIDTPCGVLTVFGVAVGASLTAVTLIDTVANPDVNPPAVTLNVKLSAPL